MIEHDRVTERLLRAGLPDPSAALRDRVTTAAMPLLLASEKPTWAERAWFSRGWRFAAAAVFVALVLLDSVSNVIGPTDATRPGTAAAESARAADEVARQAGLAPADADALARRVLLAANRPSRQDLTTLGVRP